jgi:hypothetical protein
MGGIQTYYLLCDILSCNTDPVRREKIKALLCSSEMDWPLFVKIGSNHLVLQTIYSKLNENNLTEYIPVEVLTHLKNIYNLNYKRNIEILEQVVSINSILGKNDIVPLYIKGVGNIIDGLYNTFAERIMYDIDVLVPDEQWEQAANVLLQDGYMAKKEYNPEEREETKHYPRLIKPGVRAYIELHRLPVDFEYSAALQANDVFRDKKSVNAPYCCYVLSDRHKIVQNFIHSQLKHNGDVYARVSLRNLYDLYLLSGRENTEEIFTGLNTYKNQASGYLKIMYKAFGLKIHKKSSLKYSGWFYVQRHAVNLRWRFMNLGTHYALKMFWAYVITPLQAITDKELRKIIFRKISDKKWYRQHFASYKQTYTGNFDYNSNLQ